MRSLMITADSDDAADKNGAKVIPLPRRYERYVEVPYARCEHWCFKDACVACWYRRKYPQLCSADRR
jgi:hypothetical protein